MPPIPSNLSFATARKLLKAEDFKRLACAFLCATETVKVRYTSPSQPLFTNDIKQYDADKAAREFGGGKADSFRRQIWVITKKLKENAGGEDDGEDVRQSRSVDGSVRRRRMARMRLRRRRRREGVGRNRRLRWRTVSTRPVFSCCESVLTILQMPRRRCLSRLRRRRTRIPTAIGSECGGPNLFDRNNLLLHMEESSWLGDHSGYKQQDPTASLGDLYDRMATSQQML